MRVSQIFPNIVLFADTFVCSILSSAIPSKHDLLCSIFNISDTNQCRRNWCGGGSCKKWCSCLTNGEENHKEEQESFKPMKEVGGFKGREDNSYYGEGGHKEEEGNSKPLEEDGGFEGGEPVEEDGEETATK